MRHAVGVVSLQQFLEHGKTVKTWHLHIQKHHIRMVSANQVDGLDAVLALGDDLDSSRGIQKVFELLARKPFIVDDQRSHRHVIGALRSDYEYRERGKQRSMRAGSGLDCAEAGRHIIRSQAVAAVDTVEVSNAHAAVAVAAGRGDLVGALGAEMKLGVNAGATRGAACNHRLAKQKVKDQSYATLHSQADYDPQACAHVAAWRIAAYVTNHQYI